MRHLHPITRETREAGWQLVLPGLRSTQEDVLAALRAHPAGMTAEEVQDYVGGRSLNNVRSRLTELGKRGAVEVVGKRASLRSGVKIAVWRATSNQQQEAGS